LPKLLLKKRTMSASPSVRLVSSSSLFRNDPCNAPVRVSASLFAGCALLYASNRADAALDRFGASFVVALPSSLPLHHGAPHVASLLADDPPLTALATRLALRFGVTVWLHADIDTGLDTVELWRFVESACFNLLKAHLSAPPPASSASSASSPS
jgi:hypothetical protein